LNLAAKAEKSNPPFSRKIHSLFPSSFSPADAESLITPNAPIAAVLAAPLAIR
jgi:hypothetical protein